MQPELVMDEYSFEDRLYARVDEAQFAEILMTYGEDAAKAANYGWFVDSTPCCASRGCLAVHTKVYGVGLLVSGICLSQDTEITHVMLDEPSTWPGWTLEGGA